MNKYKISPNVIILPPNAMIYGAPQTFGWGLESNDIKELTLENSFALKNRISEMHLSVLKFSAIAQNGEEHFITNFRQQKALRLPGSASGQYLKSKEIIKLVPGNYTKLRFYMGDRENTLVHSDRSISELTNEEYLDFDIANGLEIKAGETTEFVLRFDFVSFEFWSALHNYKRFFQMPLDLGLKLGKKLSNSVS